MATGARTHGAEIRRGESRRRIDHPLENRQGRVNRLSEGRAVGKVVGLWSRYVAE